MGRSSHDPWRRPIFLATATWLFILWAIVPVLIAIQFSFNSGRSRQRVAGLLVPLVVG